MNVQIRPRWIELSEMPHQEPHLPDYLEVEFLIRWPEEPEQLLKLIDKIEHQWPLPRDEQQVKPHTIVKDPAVRLQYSSAAYTTNTPSSPSTGP